MVLRMESGSSHAVVLTSDYGQHQMSLKGNSFETKLLFVLNLFRQDRNPEIKEVFESM